MQSDTCGHPDAIYTVVQSDVVYRLCAACKALKLREWESARVLAQRMEQGLRADFPNFAREIMDGT